MTEYASPEALIKVAVDEVDLPLPSGALVRVRGLSRGEVFMLQKCKADGGIKDEAAWERRMVSLALLQPALTEDQVGQWQQGPAGGDLEALTDKIQELSKLGQGAEKATYKALETSPDLEFEFYLATKLHKTVGELRAVMTQAEFVEWGVYYKRLAQQRELELAKVGERR